MKTVVAAATIAAAGVTPTVMLGSSAAHASSSCPCTVFSSSAVPSIINTGDTSANELGMKFESSESGSITAVRFYKGSQNIGTHVGHLWSLSGQLLASVTFTNETASGWQQANFASPVAITANTVYVVSYFDPKGHYSDSRSFFSNSSVSNPPLTALQNQSSRPNGVYHYGSSAFPTLTYEASNYWVDVVFTPAADTVPPSVPTGLTASAASPTQVNLAWNPSTDNVAVAGYTVFRNGSKLATTASTSYSDTTAQPSTSYSYTVGAYDTAGNSSAQSSPVSVTTPALATTTTTAAPTTSTTTSTTVAPATSSCSGTNIPAGANIQTYINNAGTGTTFCLAAGTYTPSALAPKTGDSFIGSGNRASVLEGNHSTAYAVVANGANNVTLRNLTIQDFNTPSQQAAVNAFGVSSWVIDNDHIFDNGVQAPQSSGGGGWGLAVDTGDQVTNSTVDYNVGLGAAIHGSNGLWYNDIIAHNNPNNYISPEWEAGGVKAWATTNLTFSYDTAFDNTGPGLWADTQNIGTVYDHNTVYGNTYSGIMHEVSGSATITNNVIYNNGFGKAQQWYAAGIFISSSGGQDSSHPIVIQNNTIHDNFSGISAISVSRSDAPSYQGQNIHVLNNNLTHNGTIMESGINVANEPGTYWQGDGYVDSSCGSSYWWWGSSSGFSGWQSRGQDTTGSCTVG